MAKHVMIQWLAQQDLLTEWLDLTNEFTYAGEYGEEVIEDENYLNECHPNEVITGAFELQGKWEGIDKEWQEICFKIEHELNNMETEDD